MFPDVSLVMFPNVSECFLMLPSVRTHLMQRDNYPRELGRAPAASAACFASESCRRSRPSTSATCTSTRARMPEELGRRRDGGGPREVVREPPVQGRRERATRLTARHGLEVEQSGARRELATRLEKNVPRRVACERSCRIPLTQLTLLRYTW